MATIYGPPLSVPVPVITMDDYRKRETGTDGRWVSDYEKKEAAYVEALAVEARRCQRGKADPIIGRLVRFQIADGYAEYIVWNLRPLQLVHLPLGDAWNIPTAHARGLTVTDIRAMVKRDDAWAKLFAERRAAV